MSLLRDMLDKAQKERDTAIRERDNWRAIAEASGADYRDACAEIEFLRGEVAALKKPMTDEQKEDLLKEEWKNPEGGWYDLIRSVERYHGIGKT